MNPHLGEHVVEAPCHAPLSLVPCGSRPVLRYTHSYQELEAAATRYDPYCDFKTPLHVLLAPRWNPGGILNKLYLAADEAMTPHRTTLPWHMYSTSC